MVAILPLLIGAEPFTAYWMRRAYPLWLQRGASFARISKQGFWAMLWGAAFVALAVVSIRSPAAFAMTPAYLAMIGLMVGPLSTACPSRLIHRAGLGKASAEFFILGLPLMFRRNMKSAPDLAVRFVVSGSEPATYYVEISEGRCTSGQGDLKDPSLTIYCSTDSWNPRRARRADRRSRRSPDDCYASPAARKIFSQFFQCFKLARPRGASVALVGAGAIMSSPTPSRDRDLRAAPREVGRFATAGTPRSRASGGFVYLIAPHGVPATSIAQRQKIHVRMVASSANRACRASSLIDPRTLWLVATPSATFSISRISRSIA